MSPQRLSLKGVSRTYGHVRALTDVSLELGAGQVVALLGASGAGKSTLVRLAHLLESHDAGEILIDGTRAPSEPRAHRATLRRFALVQQRPGFLASSTRENVAFPLRARGMPKRDALAQADAALAELGLTERADALATHLSGGEAQRAGLARALVTEPDFLLLDEFTNQLDPANESTAEACVLAARDRGAAILVVTHRISQARRIADAVVFLEDGRVIESGAASCVLDSPTSELVRDFLARA